MNGEKRERIETIAAELLSLLGTNRQVAPFSSYLDDFDLAEAYKVVARLRELRIARGEKPIGRKIGFTNRSVWKGYSISGPIWNYMFDTTVADLQPDASFAVAQFPELRIEPEIVLHLAKAPRAGMKEEELLGCIDLVAHGFEMVHSIFPRWEFAAADAAAAYGVHSGLLLGPWHSVIQNRGDWALTLPSFRIELSGSNGATREGGGVNVLGSPLTALRFLVEEIARFPGNEPLRAGEIITTGTLTEAMPAIAGERWRTALNGIELEGAGLAFR